MVFWMCFGVCFRAFLLVLCFFIGGWFFWWFWVFFSEEIPYKTKSLGFSGGFLGAKNDFHGLSGWFFWWIFLLVFGFKWFYMGLKLKSIACPFIPGNSLGTNFCQLHFLRKRRPLQKKTPISYYWLGKDAHWTGKDAHWTGKNAHFFPKISHQK